MMNKLISQWLPRLGLFAMIFGAGALGWFSAPMTTTAYISVGLSILIGGFIIKDRWFS